MPDKILSQDQLKQLDSNIRKMIDDGLGKEDIDTYAKDYKDKFGRVAGPSAPTAPVMKKGELPSFQQQVETLQTVQSKYDKAVQDDRSEIGKTLSSLYNGIVGVPENLVKLAAGLPAQFPVTPYQFSPIDIGKSAESARKFAELPIEERLKPVKESYKGIEGAFDLVRSGYTTREDEKQIAGQFNVFDGIGLKDFQALAAMSGGMAAEMALGAATGGATFVALGMQRSFEDFDEYAEKSGIKPDANARALYGLAGGVINGLLEKFAIDKLVGDTPVFRDLQRRAVANVLKNTANMPIDKAATVIQKAAVEEIKRLTSTIKSKGVRALYRAGVEGGTESTQAALEDGAKFAANLVQGSEVFNEQEIREGFLQNVVNSGIAGGIFGPIFGGAADVAFGRNVNTQLLKDISEADTPEALARIEQELSETFDKNNFSQEERDAIMANANRYAQIKQTIPEGTSPQAQATAIPLIESRIKIDNEIETRRNALQSLDEALVPDEEYSISLLEDKRSQINDDIREVINGEKYNYFEQDGKYFKQLGENAPEEITKNRFELQKIKEDATKTSEVQEGLTAGDISQREGTQETETQEETAETDIGYSYIVGEEGDEIPVAALLNKKVRVNGQPAILYQQGQTVEARIIGTNRIIEIGNVNKLMNELPEAYNIELDEVLVTETPQGYRIEGQSLQNTNENPLDAISFDSNGNVMNVVLTTPAGKRRKFRGQVAKDLAYQIQLKEILKDEQEFENFLEREHQQELENARLQAVAEEQAAGDTEAVPAVEAEPTPAAAVVPVEPRYGRVTVDKPVTGIRGPRLKRKAVSDANRVVTSIRSVVSKMTGRMPEINLHDQATFEEAVVAAGGTREDSTSRGFYLGTDGTIHINLDNVASDTVLHEGFHPILDFLETRNPEVINKYFAELESIPEAAPFIEAAKRDYDGDVTQKKEAITSFVAGIANGDVIINPSNFQKIRKFVLDLLNALGMGVGSPKLMNVKTPGELVELADYVTEMFREGGDVFGIALEIDRIREARRVESLEQGLVMAAGEMTPERIEESKVGNTNPIQFSRPEKFKEVELVSLPTKSMLDAYNEFGGKAVAINSDPTRVGNLTLPSGKEIFMYGGLNYTALKPNVDGEIGFASTRISKPEQVARLMNTLFQDNNGEGLVLVAAQKPDSMLGNAYSLEYTLDAVSQLPKKILRSSEFKDEFFGKDIVAIKEAFGEKEYAEFVKKFRGADLSNPEIMNTMIETLLTDIGNNFIARNSLVGNMLAGVVEKSSRAATKGQPGYVSVTPNKFIAKSLFDRFGLNQEKLFYEIGEKGIVDEYMNNGNWGFVTTGFTLDGKIDPKSIQDKGVIHPQFNAKFHGKNPFILDGAYLIDKLFPPEEITAKTGKPYVKKASLMVAGSMYPKGAIQPVAAPDTKGVPQFQKSPTKTIKSPVKRFLKNQFVVGDLLGKEVLNLKEKTGGELAQEMKVAESLSRKTMDLIKKYSSVVTQQDIEDFLTSKPNANRNLPLDLAGALSEMRSHIDNLTDRLINLGVIDDPEEIAKYQANKGKYLLRSYEIFDAQPTAMEKMLLGKSKTRVDIDNVVKKLRNVDQAKVDKALKFLQREIMKGDATLTEEQAMEKAIVEANKILADTESEFAPKKYIGSTNVKSLEERIDIAPEIRALMGEYTDPVYNYYASIFKLAALTSNRQFLNSLKEEGMGKFLFTDATKDASVQIATEGSEALKPLAGLYTFPEIKEALEKQPQNQTNIALKFLGLIRKAKTVYNPATHVKNIIGNAGFFISNGHWNDADVVWKLIKNNPKELEELMSVLTRQGVLNSSVGMGELRSYFDKHESVEDFLETVYNNAEKKSTEGKSKEEINKIKRFSKGTKNVLGSIKRSAKSIGSAIEKAYQMEDDIFKIIAFVNESNRYAKVYYKKPYSNLSESEKKNINEISSKNVKDTYPTFSRAPKFVKNLSKVFLLGNFLTFPVESVRVSYNTLKLAKSEIDSGIPELRRIGVTRLLGTLAYNGLFSTLSYFMGMAGIGLGGMIGSMFDDEEEKEKRDKMNLYRAPWTNNSEIIPLKFSDGKFVYVDIGTLDSYSYQKKVWNAFWDNIDDEEGFKKAIYASTKQFFDPYLTFDFTYQTFKDLYDNNDEGTGRQIYNPEGGYQDKVIDVSAHMLKKLGPGVVSSAMKMYKYYDEGDAEKLKNEINSQIVRTYTTDIEKQFIRYMYADRAEGTDMSDIGFKERLKDAENLYKSVKNKKGASQQDIDSAYSKSLTAYKAILRDISKYYQAAMYSGVPQENLNNILFKAGLGTPELYTIMKGEADLDDALYIEK